MTDQELYQLFLKHPDAPVGDLHKLTGLSPAYIRENDIHHKWIGLQAVQERWDITPFSVNRVDWNALAKECNHREFMRRVGLTGKHCLRFLAAEYVNRAKRSAEMLDAALFLHYFRVLGSYRAVSRVFGYDHKHINKTILRAYDDAVVAPGRHNGVLRLVKDYITLYDHTGEYDAIWDWLDGIEPTELKHKHLLKKVLTDDDPKILRKRDNQAYNRAISKHCKSSAQ